MKRTLGVVTALLVVAGCGGASTTGSTPPPTSPSPGSPARTSSPSPRPPVETVSPADLVTQVGLNGHDLATGYTLKLIPGGDRVTGQVTLDNCGFDFTTESDRVARRQTVVMSPTGQQVGLSNEVVAYDSPGHAAKALGQLRTSVTHCPHNIFEPEHIAGAPDLRYEVSKLSSDASLPVSDNALVTLTMTARGSTKPVYGAAIFQRFGTVLDAVYLFSSTKPSAASLTAVQALARLTGQRLAAT
jgi:hypothetical protein